MTDSNQVRMRFDHVSIAVKSIDRAHEFFANYFPIKPRSPKTAETQVSGSFNWLDFHLGGFVVELIEDPPGQPGFVTKFIARRGEGMHHLSIAVNNLPALVGPLKAGGVRVVDEQQFESGGATAFISPRSAFGALVQLWHVPNFGQEHSAPAPDGLAHFDHVSLAVRDIKAAYEFFTRYFPGTAIEHEPHLSNSDGNFMLGHIRVAGFKLEFIQSPPNPAANDFVGKFIDRYGEGMHHVSIDLKDFDGVCERMKRDGIRIVDEKRNWRGDRQFFISPRSAFGVLIQIWDGL
ncbi:MAG: VOC family protein [Candidatus Binataceae bacterium]